MFWATKQPAHAALRYNVSLTQQAFALTRLAAAPVDHSVCNPGNMRTAVQIPHLVELGITAVEILPVLEYDELEFQRSPNPRDHMVNVWGYSHLNFFAPMARFAAGGGGALAAATEFKQLVKALHAAGIEVILDVVYNHTNEGVLLSPGAAHSL